MLADPSFCGAVALVKPGTWILDRETEHETELAFILHR